MKLSKLIGRLLPAAALSLVLPGIAATAGTLRVSLPDGDVLFERGWPVGKQICLSWKHSVTGGAVADCFVNEGGRMILTRSYLHDFAAGLGEVRGRGTLRTAKGGGYWIENMNDPIAGNMLALRVGSSSVDHRLTIDDVEYGLSTRAAGRKVTLELTETP